MYGRDYRGKTLNFEASGGLMNSSLVMQDKQTDSYWSIMTGDAIGGEYKGTKLVELPVSKKVEWKDWVEEHPDTLVLSVNGEQDAPDPYADYFRSRRGFRGQQATDGRLNTKDSIYAFRYDDRPYAIDTDGVEGGKTFELHDGSHAFAHRAKGAELFEGSSAYWSELGFERRGEEWVEVGTGARFSPQSGEFEGGTVYRLSGFDTFWYNWSLNNPDTALLK